MMTTTTIPDLRAAIAAREAQHPATPPRPPSVGRRIAAWAEAQELSVELLAFAVGLSVRRVRAICAGAVLTADEANRCAVAMEDDRVRDAAATERLEAQR